MWKFVNLDDLIVQRGITCDILILYLYNTRYASNQNFCKPYIRTNTGKQIFSYKAIDLWHDIFSYLKDLSTFSFAKEVKQYLLFKQCS